MEQATTERASTRTREKHFVALLRDLPPGSRKIVSIQGRSIGVFNIDGQFYALKNSCPHQGAPLCAGRIKGTRVATKPFEYVYARENEIIKCPWHGWEFEISTGRSIFNPHRVRVQTYDVTVEAQEEPDPSIEMYPVTVEEGVVMVHV
ncbi:MAG: 2Fe-2S ferredoxin [Chloroflexi bacterium]|nr:MAG: 2Fe-2S ferredoxin [Chloroflexota bacterium]